jgi:hypothetical protein
LLRFEQQEIENDKGKDIEDDVPVVRSCEQNRGTTSELPDFIKDVLGQLRVNALSTASFYAESRFLSVVVG